MHRQPLNMHHLPLVKERAATTKWMCTEAMAEKSESEDVIIESPNTRRMHGFPYIIHAKPIGNYLWNVSSKSLVSDLPRRRVIFCVRRRSLASSWHCDWGRAIRVHLILKVPREHHWKVECHTTHSSTVTCSELIGNALDYTINTRPANEWHKWMNGECVRLLLLLLCCPLHNNCVELNRRGAGHWEACEVHKRKRECPVVDLWLLLLRHAEG